MVSVIRLLEKDTFSKGGKMNNAQDIVLYPLRRKQPVVVVNAEGVTYNPPVLPLFKFNATISWSEIAAIYPDEIRTQQRLHPYLAIVPKDIKSFLRSAYPFHKRLMIASTSFGTPLPIVQTFLPISVEDLFSQICTQYHDKIEMYGIRTAKD